MRRILWLVFLWMLLFMSLSLAEDFQLQASCPAVSEGVITAWSKNNLHHLFVPGSWDLTQIRIDVTGDDSVQVGDQLITSGETVDVSGWLEVQTTLRIGSTGKGIGKLVVHQGSPVPVLFLTVDPDQYAKVNKDKTLTIDDGTALFIEADGTTSYSGALTQLKGHGNATYAPSYTKKPYQIKLNKKASLAGLSKGKTWILLANYTDVSLLHNQVTLEMCRAAGLPYTVGCSQIELYVNGEYRGLYLLAEKIQISSKRLNITNLEEETQKLLEKDASEYTYFKKKSSSLLSGMRGYELPANPEDITGGYLLEIEKPYRYQKSQASGFVLDSKLCVIIKEPTYASREQVTYIGELMYNVQQALMRRDGTSPVSGIYYTDYLDVTSFAKKALIESIVMNFDYKSASQYLYKDSDLVDGKLYAGPGWDYDLTFGALTEGTEGMYIFGASDNNFWYLLSTHEEFKEALAREYKETFRPILDVLLGNTEPAEGSSLKSISAYQEAIAASAAMNFVRWNESKCAEITNGNTGTSFQDGTRVMINFLKKRYAWMDQHFGIE